MTSNQADTLDTENIKSEQAQTIPSQKKRVFPSLTNALKLEVFELALILLGLYVALRWLPIRRFLDADVRLGAIFQLMTTGKVSNVEYSMIGPSFSIPLWWIDHSFISSTDWYRANWWIGKYNIFLVFTVLLLTYFLVRRRMDATLMRRFILILLTASMFGNMMTYYGGEIFTGLLVGMGILIAYLVFRGGWVAVAVGAANTPASMIGIAVVTLSQIVISKKLRYALVALGAVGLVLAENWFRRGSPLNGGYEGQTFSTPFLLGFFSILLSFGHGLIFYVSALFLPAKKYILKLEGENQDKLYKVYLLWISFIIGLLLVYSVWWDWSGAWAWGPRFFLFASIPASFVLAVRLRKPANLSFVANAITLLVLCYAFYVGLNGAMTDLMQGDLGNICGSNNYALGYLCDYHPLYSPLWRPFVTHQFHSMLVHYLPFVLYTVTVFLYLVAPLLLTMAKQVLPWLQHIKSWALRVRI